MAKKTEAEKLADLEAKKKALEAQMQAIQSRQKERLRKADTRRKVVLGGMLLAKAEQDERIARMVADMVKAITRPADRSAFDGWTPSKPAAAAVEG
jgi:hypothetical protein